MAGIILLTNSRTLLKTFEVATPARFAIYGGILVITGIGFYLAAQRAKAAKARRSEQADAAADRVDAAV